MLNSNLKFENVTLFFDMFILRVLFQNTTQKRDPHENKANILRLSNQL